MSDSVYITASEARAGKGLVALGLMELIAGQADRIAVFRPVTGGAGRDPLVDMLLTRYRLDQEYATAAGTTYAETGGADAGDRDRLVAAVVDRFSRLRARYDFVLCVGSDFTGPTPATELDLNATLAANLGTPVVAVVSGHGRTPGEIDHAVASSTHVLGAHGCTVLATMVNRTDPAAAPQLRHRLGTPADPVYVLAELPVLSALTVEEVADALGGQVVGGRASALQREVGSYVVGSGHLQTLLPLLRDDCLVVASGDRVDLAVGTAAAAASPHLPTPSGVVLTCGHSPDALTRALLEPSGVPMITVKDDTYATLHALEGMHGIVRAGSRRKIAAALGEFTSAVDTDRLAARIRVSRTEVVTPLMFSFGLLDRARADRRRIVLPESGDERVLRAAEELVHAGVVDLTLLGAPEAVRARARALGLDLGGIDVVDPATSELGEELAVLYAGLRAHKGVTVELARETVQDPSYFGTLLVATGRVDGMVSGAAHTTAHTIRPALEVIKTTPGTSLVSSAFLMCLPERVLVFADCAVNPDPTAEQLADIACDTADTAAAFGISPRVAMVSYSTGSSGSGRDVDKVRTAARLVAERRPDLPLAGPIQYDAAVDPGVAAAKMPDNPVAGHATVLVFPDLNTGNTTYKAVQRTGSVVAIGPVLQGLRRPVNDLSRGCTVPDVVNTVAITAIQAQRVARAARG